MTKVRNFTYLLLLIALIAVFCGTLTKLKLPLAEWDHVSLAAAESWSRGINTPWVFDHPPLYPFFLTLIFKFTGPSPVVARLANLLCVILTSLVLFNLTAEIFNKDAALWAVIFYLLSPVCIQGTQLTDLSDASILPLIFLLIANSIKNITFYPGPQKVIILSCVVALSFWAKATSTLAFLIAIFISYLYIYFFRREKDQNVRITLNIAALGFGLILFLLSWTFVSTLLWGSGALLPVLKTPWSAIHVRIVETSYLSKLLLTAYETFRLCIWFSPYLLLMWLAISWKTVKEKSQLHNNYEIFNILFVCTTILYFVGYLLIGGTNWGYPRYHNAILPFLCMFAGRYTYNCVIKINRSYKLPLLIILVLSVCISAYFFQDPLLFLNLRIKELLLSGNGFGDIVKKAILTFIPFYGLAPLLLLFWFFLPKAKFKSNAFAISVIVCLLSTLLSLDIQQTFASYRTSNQYGAEGKTEVLHKVRTHVVDRGYILATPEFIYDLNDQNLPHIEWGVWKSKDTFIEFTESHRPQAIIAGLTINTYYQLKWLLSEDIQRFLCRNYDFIPIGTYYLWLRNSTNN